MAVISKKENNYSLGKEALKVSPAFEGLPILSLRRKARAINSTPNKGL